MKARLPKGMGGGPANMQNLMKQAQKMQEDMETLKSEFDEKVFTVQAGGGACEITITGAKKVQDIKLDNDIIDPDDPDTLTDILIAGINEALSRVEEEYNSEIEKITGNAGLPGGLF